MLQPRLYQPILLKRWKLSKWEKGWKVVSNEGEFILEEDKKTIINQVQEYKVNWF